MEAGFIALIALAVTLGIVIGMHIKKTDKTPDSFQGVLNVSYDPRYGSPDLFLNLQVPVEEVISRKHVAFYVNVIHPNSQK